MDPTYATSKTRVFNEYDPNSFGVSDLDRLKNAMDTLDSKGAKFLVSYANCEETEQLISKYNCVYVDVRRNIAGFTGSRGFVTEVLISNFKPWQRKKD